MDECFLQKEWQILLIPLQEVVLFPGDTLPLRLGNGAIARAVKDIIAHDLPNTRSDRTVIHCPYLLRFVSRVSYSC